jgi:hypothetical protein
VVIRVPVVRIVWARHVASTETTFVGDRGDGDDLREDGRWIELAQDRYVEPCSSVIRQLID